MENIYLITRTTMIFSAYRNKNMGAFSDIDLAEDNLIKRCLKNKEPYKLEKAEENNQGLLGKCRIGCFLYCLWEVPFNK